MTDDDIELVRRRLVDGVREDVRGQLFRTYAIAGVAVAGALGLVGWNSVAEINEEARFVAQEVRRETGKAVEQMHRDAKAALDALKMAIEEDLDQLKTRVAEQAGRIGAESDRAGALLDDVGRQLGDLTLNRDAIKDLNESVASLQDARRTLAVDIEDVKTRTQTLGVLADEMKRLAEELRQQAPAGAAVYASVLENVKGAESRAELSAARTTVYLQFAGGARALAQDLSRRLAGAGFFMPGEERTGAAAGLREVRYYHEADRPEAERLAAQTDQALLAMRRSTRQPIAVRNLTEWTAIKPRPGILELWVEL